MENVKVKKILLVIFGAGAISGYILLPVAGLQARSSGASSGLFGMAGMLITFSALGGLIAGYKQADETGLDPAAWAAAAFVFPWVIPFILAFKKESPYRASRAERKKLRVEGHTLIVRHHWLNQIQLPLDGMRLVSLTMPGGKSTRRWKPALGLLSFEHESEIESYQLDLISDQEFATLFHCLRKLFSEHLVNKRGRLLPERKRLEVMGFMKIHLKDYRNQESQISMRDVLLSPDDVIAALEKYRPQRIQRLRAWLLEKPEVMVGNGFPKSKRGMLGQQGIRCGKAFQPWENVQIVKILPAAVWIGFANPPSRWEKAWSIQVDKKKNWLAAADFFFWRYLHLQGQSDRRPEDEHRQLVQILDGRVLCTGCLTVQDVMEGALSSCCQKPAIRFRAAQKEQHCSCCQAGLPDRLIGMQTPMAEIFPGNGFECPACGKQLCAKCASPAETAAPAAVCSCGGLLALRV